MQEGKNSNAEKKQDTQAYKHCKSLLLFLSNTSPMHSSASREAVTEPLPSRVLRAEKYFSSVPGY